MHTRVSACEQSSIFTCFLSYFLRFFHLLDVTIASGCWGVARDVSVVLQSRCAPPCRPYLCLLLFRSLSSHARIQAKSAQQQILDAGLFSDTGGHLCQGGALCFRFRSPAIDSCFFFLLVRFLLGLPRSGHGRGRQQQKNYSRRAHGQCPVRFLTLSCFHVCCVEEFDLVYRRTIATRPRTSAAASS